MAHGAEVTPEPEDGIASLRFADDDNSLLVASWDGTLRLYDANSQGEMARIKVGCPALNACFAGRGTLASAGLDGIVREHKLGEESGERAGRSLGQHSRGVRCMSQVSKEGVFATASWDGTASLWDARAGACVAKAELPGKAFAMDVSPDGSRLIIATSGRHLLVYDSGDIGAGPLSRRESILKYQTRCIKCFPNGRGFALSSVEGRAGVDYFDHHMEQAKPFAFKCHRRKESGQDVVFPVNALAFHPLHETFATGGCDCCVCVWDPFKRKRIYQYSPYPTSISSLSFNHDGSLLAVASSYTFEQGEDTDQPPDQVFIRHVNPNEVRPRA